MYGQGLPLPCRPFTGRFFGNAPVCPVILSAAKNLSPGSAQILRCAQNDTSSLTGSFPKNLPVKGPVAPVRQRLPLALATPQSAFQSSFTHVKRGAAYIVGMTLAVILGVGWRLAMAPS